MEMSHWTTLACARIIWCGMCLRLFLDLVAQRSEMQNVVDIVNTPSHAGNYHVPKTTVPIPESSGVGCVCVCGSGWPDPRQLGLDSSRHAPVSRSNGIAVARNKENQQILSLRPVPQHVWTRVVFDNARIRT